MHKVEEYYVLVNKLGHYLRDFQPKAGIYFTTRHIQNAQWFLHTNYCPEGFTLHKLSITVESLNDKTKTPISRSRGC